VPRSISLQFGVGGSLKPTPSIDSDLDGVRHEKIGEASSEAGPESPAVLEMWAFLSEDVRVKAIHEESSASFATPTSHADLAAVSFDGVEHY